jgi:hypothetical protein
MSPIIGGAHSRKAAAAAKGASRSTRARACRSGRLRSIRFRYREPRRGRLADRLLRQRGQQGQSAERDNGGQVITIELVKARKRDEDGNFIE